MINNTNKRTLEHLSHNLCWWRNPVVKRKNRYLKTSAKQLQRIFDTICNDMCRLYDEDMYIAYASYVDKYGWRVNFSSNEGIIDLGINKLTDSQIMDILYYIINSNFETYFQQQCDLSSYAYNKIMKLKTYLKDCIANEYPKCKKIEMRIEKEQKNQLLVRMIWEDLKTRRSPHPDYIDSMVYDTVRKRPMPPIRNRIADIDSEMYRKFGWSMAIIWKYDKLEVSGKLCVDLGINKLTDSQLIDILQFAAGLVALSTVDTFVLPGDKKDKELIHELSTVWRELDKWIVERYQYNLNA